MREDVAGVLIRLHSRAWRERYGAEWRALLLDLPARPDVIADCVGNALASHYPKPNNFGFVQPAIAFGALLLFVGIPLHPAGNARANEVVVSVHKAPATLIVRRSSFCNPAYVRYSARVRRA